MQMEIDDELEDRILGVRENGVLSADKLTELEEMFGLFKDSLRRGIKNLEGSEKKC